MAVNAKFAANVDNEDTIQPMARTGFAFPYGNVGPWQKRDALEISGENALDVATAMGFVPDSFRKSQSSAWTWLYFKVGRQAEANEVARKVRNNEKAFGTFVSQLHCDPANVLPEPIEFDLTYIIEKKGYGGSRHEPYQLFFLPSVVWAYAKNVGYDVPDITFNRVSNPKEFVAFADNKELDDYLKSVVAQRAALWSALGEANLRVDTAMGALNGKGVEIKGANVTASEKLSEALQFAQGNWTNIWMRVGQIVNPLDASGKGRIPVVSALYDNEHMARVAATHGDEPTGEFAGLYVPESFAASMSPEEFAGALVSDLGPKYETYKSAKIGPAKVKAKTEFTAALTEFELSEEQFMAWAAKLGL